MKSDKNIQLSKRLEDGSINEQCVWKYVKERNTADCDQLCRTAIIDCTRTYSYGQMFTEWEHYARVFSVLGMTGKNHSRVGIAGTISAEPLFSFYGLNMTGATVSMLSYPDFLPAGQWRIMTEKEKLTDLVLSDIMITPEMWPELQKAKEELGLRNIILLHSRLGGPCTGPAELVYNEYNYHMLKRLGDTVFMEDLLKKYGTVPIVYGDDDPDHLAIITHTSGTAKGTRKPLPYAERSVNIVATMLEKSFRNYRTDFSAQLRTLPSFDFSSFMSMCGLVNGYLSAGETVILTFFGFMNPKFIRAVDYYNVNVLFVSGFMIDSWLKRKDIDEIDFSSLIVFSCGGSYISPESLRRYTRFVHDHGFTGNITRGYGMSESGGAQLFVPDGCEDDILGFPVPKESFLIQDENDGKFYTADDGIRTGVMYIASDSLCRNELDGEVLFDFTKINGKDYICSNDLVHVNPNGSFSYVGRTDHYFVNNEGIRFEAGIVESKITRQPGINQCAVVPVLDKRIHDTVPVLYVVSEGKTNAEETVRRALVNVFVRDKLIEKTVLPSQFVLTDEIPCNSNGKIDIYRITRERLKGNAYNILPIKGNGILSDIVIKFEDHPDSITGGTLPEGMGGGSAFNIN